MAGIFRESMCARTLRRILTRSQRRVLLVAVENPTATQQAIAAMLGMSQPAVSKNIRRANESLTSRGLPPFGLRAA
jgi:DNA-binding MarR family transcriptional regulator